MNEVISLAANAGTVTSSASVRFGIILDINGTSVPISSGDLANARANGVEFNLQNPIDLGSIKQFETWVSDKFGVSLPSASDLPPPLDAVVNAITNMEITVEKAHIKVPGTASVNGTVQYTLETNGTFMPEISLIDGKLGIQGLVFGFSNETIGS
jgi:hypothetical protein